MKALTLWQPWATLVALGVKTIETRSWSTSYRGPLAIHAAAKKPACPHFIGSFGVGHHRIRYAGRVDEGYTLARTDCRPDDHGVTEYPTWTLPLGEVVATCTLADVLPMVDATQHRQDEQVSHVAVSRSHLGLWRPTGGYCWTATVIEEQRPYGDFTPGRFAWLLADIKPVDPPVPARGRQQLWEWIA